MSDERRRWSVRRLLSDEAEKIRDIQAAATYLPEFYPDHDQWVDRTIKQIECGEREAFAVFESTFTLDRSGRESLDRGFVGSAILKRALFSDGVELKNFLVDGRRFSNPNDIDIARRVLLDKIRMYCERRGFKRLSTEVPPVETDMIAFLHGQKFKVSSVVRSRYRDGDFFYILTLDLHARYSADPFDFDAMVHWIIRNRLQILRRVDVGLRMPTDPDDPTEVIETLRFELPMNDAKYPAASREQIKLLVECRIVDSSRYIELPQDLFPDRAGLHLLFVNSDNHLFKEYCAKHRVTCFLRQDVRQLLGAEAEPSGMYFERDEIGGMLISIGQHHFDRMKEIAVTGGQFAYFLWWGGFGQFADHPRGSRTKNVVIFHFPVASTTGTPGTTTVYFYAEIDRAYEETADIVWEDYKNMETLLEHRDYLLFTRHTEEKHVVALTCKNLSYLELPQGRSFFDLIEEIDGKSARSFYESKLFESGVVTTYLSAKVRDAFMRRCASKSPVLDEGDDTIQLRRTSAGDLKFDVAFSFPGSRQARVLEVVAAMRRLAPDVTIFVDIENEAMVTGTTRMPVLLRVYRESLACVAVFADGYGSKWCQMEWGELLERIHMREPKPGGVARARGLDVLFLALDQTRPPDFRESWGAITLEDPMPVENAARVIIERVRELQGKGK